MFFAQDAAKKTRQKNARRTEILPCNRTEFSRQDAALTYSHDDGCFYVVQLPQAPEMSRAQADAPTPVSVYLAAPKASGAAKEGNVSFKQLSPEHQKLFEAAREKEGNSLVSAGAVRILTQEESRKFEEIPSACWTRSGRSGGK